MKDKEQGYTESWQQRHSITLDIASGLKYLHSQTEKIGFCWHGDIKGKNILLRTETNPLNARENTLRAMIGDFGLSKMKLMDAKISRNSGYIRGSDLWMAPEIFLNETSHVSF